MSGPHLMDFDFVPGVMEPLNDVVTNNDETDSRDLAPNLPQNYRMTSSGSRDTASSRDSSIRSGSVFSYQRENSLRSHDADVSYVGGNASGDDDESTFMGSVASASRSIFSTTRSRVGGGAHPWERGGNDPLSLSNRSAEQHAARKPWGSGSSVADRSSSKHFGSAKKDDVLDQSTRSTQTRTRHQNFNSNAANSRHQGQAAHTMGFSFATADPAQLKRAQSHSPPPPAPMTASSVFSSLLGYATESDTEKKFYNDHTSSDDDMSTTKQSSTFASLFRLQEEEVEDDFEHHRIKEGIELSRQKNKQTRKTAYEVDNPRASTLVVRPDVGMNGTSTEGDGWKHAIIGQELEEDSESASHGDTSIDSLDELLHPELAEHRPGHVIQIEQESIASLEASLTMLDAENAEMESSQVIREEAEEQLNNLDHAEAVINTFNEILEMEEAEQLRIQIAMQESLPSLNSVGSLMEDLPSDDDEFANLALKTYVVDFMDSMDYTLKHPPKAKLSDLFKWSEKKNVDRVERTKQKRIEANPVKHVSSADALFRPAEEKKEESASEEPRPGAGWIKIGGAMVKRNEVAMRRRSVEAREQSVKPVAPQNELPVAPDSTDASKEMLAAAAKVASEENPRTLGVSPKEVTVVESPTVVQKKSTNIDDKKELSSVPIRARDSPKVSGTNEVPKARQRNGILENESEAKPPVITAAPPPESAPIVRPKAFLKTEPAVRKSLRFEGDLAKQAKGDKVMMTSVRKIEKKATSVEVLETKAVSVKVLQPQESAPPVTRKARVHEATVPQANLAVSGERKAVTVNHVVERQKYTTEAKVDGSVRFEINKKETPAEVELHESQKAKPTVEKNAHAEEGKPREKTPTSLAHTKSSRHSTPDKSPVAAEPVRRKSRKDDAKRLETIPMSIVTSEGGDKFAEGLERRQLEPDKVTKISHEGSRKNGSKTVRQPSGSSSDNSFVASANSSRHSRSSSSRGIDLDDTNKPSSSKRRSTANGTKSSSTGSHRKSKRGQDAAPQKVKPDLVTAFNKNSSSFRRADVESRGTEPITSSIVKEKTSNMDGEEELSLSISPEEVLMALMGGSLSKTPLSNSKKGPSSRPDSESVPLPPSAGSSDRSTPKHARRKTRLEKSASSESRGSRASSRDSSPTSARVSSRRSGEHRSSKKSNGVRRSTHGDSEVSVESRDKRVSSRGTRSSRTTVSSSATKERGVELSEKPRASQKSNRAEVPEIRESNISTESPVTKMSSPVVQVKSPETSRKHRSSKKGDGVKEPTPVERVVSLSSQASVIRPSESKLDTPSSDAVELEGSEKKSGAKVSTADQVRGATIASAPLKKRSSRVKSLETKEPIATINKAVEDPKKKSSKVETSRSNDISTGRTSLSGVVASATPQASTNSRSVKSSDSVEKSSTRKARRRRSSISSASRARGDDKGVRSDDDDSIDISKPVFRKAPSRPRRASAKSIQITPTSSGTQTTTASSQSGQRKTRRAETPKPTSSSPTRNATTENKTRKVPVAISADAAPPVSKSDATDRNGKKTKGRRSNSLPPNKNAPKAPTVTAPQTREKKLRARAGSMPPKVNTVAPSRKSSRTPEQAKERRKKRAV